MRLKDSPGMTAQTQHPFSADRPIVSHQEDLLGRAAFSESVATAIRNWREQESLVIAIYGPWGSGKSSVKNMVLESTGNGNPPISAIEFNPWQWASQDQVAEAFFREIGVALGQVPKDGQRLAAKWQAYAAFLQLGANVISGLRGVAIGLIGLLTAVGLGSLIDVPWVRTTSAVIGASAVFLLAFLVFSGRVAAAIAEAVAARSEAQRRTLPERKDEIASLLRGLPTPVLVVMDDVDRLAPTEIRQLFQLVKANADFPNLVYLLLFQRDIVERSLSEVLDPSDSPDRRGRDFLGKIVQVGFDLPAIERSRLEKVLTTGLDEFLGDERVSERFAREHWAQVFLPGLRHYFANLRDVRRLLGSLSFHIGLFQTETSFEVNPVDLIALEVLRMFEPDLYGALPGASELLTRTSDEVHLLSGGKQDTERRSAVEAIIATVPPDRRMRAQEILTALFPPIAWVFGGSNVQAELREEWLRDLRVCHPDVFDRYFHFAIPVGDVSQADIDRVLSFAGERDRLVGVFRDLQDRELLEAMLDRLEAYKQQIDVAHARSFVTALFDIGDEIAGARAGFFEIEPHMRAVRIVHWYLMQEPSASARADILEECMRESRGLFLPVEVTSLEHRKHEQNERPDTYLVDGKDVVRLEEICTAKIREAAEAGHLRQHPRFAYILYRWLEWTSPDEVRTWVSRLIETEEGLLDFLKGVTQPVVSHGMGQYVSRTSWRIRLDDIAAFVPLDLVKQRVEALPSTGRSEEDEHALAAFDALLRGGETE
jgi:predicted KAP-like P-loop ATPase